MAHFDLNQRAFGTGERRMLAPARAAQPGCLRVVARVVLEQAFEHQNFFTAAMYMPRKAGARQLTHDAGGPGNFAADPVKHAALNAGRW